MSGYHTEQKQLLADFLKKHNDRAFTVEEICTALQKQAGKDAPGKSTLYRLMTGLVEDGSVKRFVRGNSRKFVYQLVGGEHCDAHLHLKCTDCGRLFHMEEQASDELLSQIRAISNFSVNEEKTVLFGTCADCKHGQDHGKDSHSCQKESSHCC